MLYVITGSIPSKKNSRINTRSGRSFPSKTYRDWHESAGFEIKSQGIVTFQKPVEMEIDFYFKNNIRTDLDNKLSSIQDLLVDLGILQDDRWQLLPDITLTATIDKENPRAEIYLHEIDDD